MPKVERGRRVVLWLGVACIGLLPMALSCSKQKTPGAAEANERGLSHAEKGDHDQAIADFTEAIRLDPKNADAYYSRALSYDLKSDHDQAIADFTEAIRLHPNNAKFYAFRAKAYRALGEEVKAASDDRKAQEFKK
jgi:tetratricopeptide (TPR) repeat protein